ncbi:MAG: ribose 5-phosphate isomerase A [Candidatus Melainabacteria bacterium]|nr:MAG: ribose 5-phosphate isomerase A [Candidatus Melainabacteria bacterium]
MTTAAQTSDLKKRASYKAVEFVKDGMLVGLGTGSTATFAVDALAERIAQGLKIEAIATSEKTAEQARRLGIKLTDFAHHHQIDLTIDGADEVEVSTLNLIKGLGGALYREKVVASVSKRLVIVVDQSKLVDRLGTKTAVPVEVVPFGWQLTAERLKNLGSTPELRLTSDKKPYLTDNGNYIIDCRFGKIEDSAGLADQIGLTIGVVESGLFVKMTSLVVAGKSQGIEILSRS